MLKTNIIANFFGVIWPSLLGFFITPVYIHLLGIDAYGLIGFFVSLQGLIAFLDMGLSTTANREFARYSNKSELITESRNLLRTLELVYGIIAFFIIFSFFISSNWLATQWLTSSKVDSNTIRIAVIIFGVTIGLRWPSALYIGVLRGLEKQILQNILVAITATIRMVGAVGAVIFFSHTLVAFLLWQLFSAIIEIISLHIVVWRLLPHSKTIPKFSSQIFKSIWRFSTSVGVNSLLSSVFKQFDRLLISWLMSLQWLGYYTTANIIYQGLSIIVSPIINATFPRFSSLLAKGDTEKLADIYHKSSQFISFFVCPVTSVVFYFSYHILLLWTNSKDVAQNAYITLSILAIAYMFNSQMHLPTMLQFAAGVTRIALSLNLVAIIIFTPLTYFLIRHFGINGAGTSWAIFNVLYYTIIPQIMHLQILPREKRKWIFQDTLPFMFISLSIYGIAAWACLLTKEYLIMFTIVLIASLVYLIICLFVYPSIRLQLIDLMFKKNSIQTFEI